MSLDPQPGADHPAVVNQLRHHFLDKVCRDRKADAPRVGNDRSGNPNDVAATVDQRATGVAGIDRGVRLQQRLRQRPRSAREHTIDCRYYPARDCLVQSERVPDGVCFVTDPHAIRITELSIRLWNGKALPAALKSRLKREWEHVLFVKKQIQALEGERRRALKKQEGADKQQESADLDKVRQLAMLGGIGTNGSWVLVRELFGWRKFGNRRQVGSLSGLTPTPYQSGDSRREQGISHAGNCHVRDIAIELAWCWVRYQPESKLTRWYMERFANGGPRARKVGIVALARRLLIDLWKFLETGVIPEGARLKAEA